MLLPVAARLICSSVSFAPWRCRTHPCTSPRPSVRGQPQCWTSLRNPAASPSTRCSCVSTSGASVVSWQQLRPRHRVRRVKEEAGRRRLKPTSPYVLPPHLPCQMTCYLWTAKTRSNLSSSAIVTLKVTSTSKFL